MGLWKEKSSVNQAKPTREEWSSLYQVAVDFKRSACWEWMYDDDIFGVVDPETGETAYKSKKVVWQFKTDILDGKDACGAKAG